jgi:hypothetical protein
MGSTPSRTAVSDERLTKNRTVVGKMSQEYRTFVLFCQSLARAEICLIERGQEAPDFACGTAKRLSEYYFPVE